MRKAPLLLASVLSLLTAWAAPVQGGPITPGDLVVVRVGDGTSSLSSSATAVFLDEYTTAGVLKQSISLPNSSSSANTGGLTLSGSASSEGHLNLSTNGQYMTLIGYDAALGTASVASTSSSAANRTIDVLNLSTGTVDNSTRLNNAMNGNNARGVISTDGTKFWAVGAPGVVTAVKGAIAATSIDTGTSARGVTINGNTLLVSSAANSVSNYGNGSLPTTTTSPTALGITNQAGSPNPNAMVFLNRNGGSGDPKAGGADTLYLADGGGATNGLQKFEWNGSSWVSKGVASNAPTGGLFGLTGVVSGGHVTLYGTQVTGSANTLVSFTDSAAFGSNISGSFTTLATAATNETFRGVALAPVPEPASMALAGLVALGLAGAAWRRHRKAAVAQG